MVPKRSPTIGRRSDSLSALLDEAMGAKLKRSGANAAGLRRTFRTMKISSPPLSQCQSDPSERAHKRSKSISSCLSLNSSISSISATAPSSLQSNRQFSFVGSVLESALQVAEDNSSSTAFESDFEEEWSASALFQLEITPTQSC